ncbi:TlpA family protein disulfide reductase [Luteolibacter flavescens]|uniref:TlpA family protein disulfide reductase n=1 Tax=Luteolibacter flavescens TaxID=1859460 RepID=A0ABT3FLV5_9BACT|nr:TlpA disulfide reductase family protein [Luteolibacter flavescens]MCW1884437.1 TlpA family protein disulfide reductase [Luteolibacter flavescens]
MSSFRRSTSTVAALLMLAATCFAQEPKPATEEDPYASLPPQRAALERMISERGTPEAFDAAVKKAREQGVGEQPILEARFLYHVDRGEDDLIAAMLPEFLKRKEEFKIEQSEIFAIKEDWLAVVEYVQAIAALKKEDRDGFKKHITEAFWLSPRQASAFAPHIDRLRLDEAMRSIKIDGSAKLSSLLADKPVELGSLMKDKKATLLHFWSPWSRECEASMPDFKVTATELEKNGVAVVSLLAEFTADAAKDAKEVVSGLGAKPPGAWLQDREKDSFMRKLRVQDLPTMVLVSPDGSVIFNGHPSDDGLWKSLSKLAPDLKRPSIEGH